MQKLKQAFNILQLIPLVIDLFRYLRNTINKKQENGKAKII